MLLVRRYLESAGIATIIIERQVQMMSNPIESIRDIVSRSTGTVVIATERFQTTDTVEFPKTMSPRVWPVRHVSTVWNQIEAAMTLQSRNPLLILCEEGLTPEGIIDPAIHPVVEFAIAEPMDELPQPVAKALAEWCTCLSNRS